MAIENNTDRWTADEAGILATSPVYLKRIVWEEPAENGDSIEIDDMEGNLVWHYNALSSGTGVSFNEDIYKIVDQGLQVSKIESGKLIFHIE